MCNVSAIMPVYCNKNVNLSNDKIAISSDLSLCNIKWIEEHLDTNEDFNRDNKNASFFIIAKLNSKATSQFDNVSDQIFITHFRAVNFCYLMNCASKIKNWWGDNQCLFFTYNYSPKESIKYYYKDNWLLTNNQLIKEAPLGKFIPDYYETVNLKDVISVELVKEWYSKLSFINPLGNNPKENTNSKYYRILETLKWLSSSICDEDIADKNMKLIIAFECLLEKHEKGIQKKMRNNVKNLLNLSSDKEHQFKVYFEKAYSFRSYVVHGNINTSLPSQAFEHYLGLIKILRSCINKLLVENPFDNMTKMDDVFEFINK